MNRKPVYLLLAALTVTPLVAADGRIPLWEPTVITTPGHYVLTRDIIAAAGPILDIQSEGVTVDLNGFEIGSPDATQPVVRFAPPVTLKGHDQHQFLLRDGRIWGGLHNVQVHNLQMRNVVLEELQLGGAATAAVLADGLASFEARGIIIIDGVVGLDLRGGTPGAGYSVFGAASIRNSIIEADVAVRCMGLSCAVRHSTLTVCESAIRLEDAPTSVVMDNGLNIKCSDPGVQPPAGPLSVLNSPSTTIAHNTLRGDPTSTADNHGIFVDATSANVLVMHNSISGNGDDGIRVLAMDGNIKDNLVSNNGGHGLFVGGAYNLVEGNKAGSNGGDGLHVDTANQIFRDNVLLFNDANPVGGKGMPDLVDGGGNVQ